MILQFANVFVNYIKPRLVHYADTNSCDVLKLLFIFNYEKSSRVNVEIYQFFTCVLCSLTHSGDRQAVRT